MQFAIKLKELRKDAKLTQAELADVLGIKRATVTQYESGRISPSNNVLLKLANYFRVSVEELISLEGSEKDDAFFTNIQLSEKSIKNNNYTVSLKSAIAQRIVSELYKKSQDQFIEENKNLFLRLIDTLLEINIKAEECNHKRISLDFYAEDYDINKIVNEFSKELHRLEKLSNLFE